MKLKWVSGAGVATVALALVAAPARASIVFSSTLNGESERPSPVVGAGIGAATAMLSGDSGSYVLSYTLNFAGLSSDAVSGHIHYSILPPGRDPAQQTGPVVHGVDADFGALGTEGTISGQWRFDDAGLPLTDALADSLLDGELYFNIHTATHLDGEIRGQLQALGGTTDNGPGPSATAIPLPPALLLGLAGLGAAGWATRRRRAITR